MSREIAILLTLLHILPIGPSVELPQVNEPTIVWSLDYAATFLWGGVIFMAYCEPYKRFFTQKTLAG